MGKILIIDDNKEMLTTLSLSLSEHEVLLMDSVDNLKDLPSDIDILICDLILPEENSGFDIISYYKNNYSGVNTIAISAGGDIMEPEKLLNTAEIMGADYLLPKPFKVDSFIDLITCLLNHPGDCECHSQIDFMSDFS